MSIPRRRLRSPLLHPLLFAWLPVLFLYAHNLAEMHLEELLLPLLLTTAAALLVWGLLRLMLRDWVRAAVLASGFWLWFASFGHVYQLDQRLAPASFQALLAGYVLLWPALLALALWRKPNLQHLSAALDLMAVALIALQVISIGRYELTCRVSATPLPTGRALRLTATRINERPNIYFIVLDGYGREDVLRDIYRHDNSEFLCFLERNGFAVAHRARANYCQTALSLSSCLNLSYLDSRVRAMGPEASDRRPLERSIDYNRTTDFLRAQGYRIVAFATAYEGTEMRSADVYRQGRAGLSEFQSGLLEATPLLPLFRARGLVDMDANHTRARQVLYTFDHLAEAGRADVPVFVYAHIIAPHPPFIFLADGRMKDYVRATGFADGVTAWGTPKAYIRGYRPQVEFITRRTRQVIAEILAQAPRPTVIVLLSDHGPGSSLDWGAMHSINLTERLGILLAVRLPGKPRSLLPDDASTVNTMRLVLREYFGADLPPLPSRSYVSSFLHPYRMTPVTVDAQGKLSWPNSRPPAWSFPQQ